MDKIATGDTIKVIQKGRHCGKIGIVKSLIGEISPFMWRIKIIFGDKTLLLRGDEIRLKEL